MYMAPKKLSKKGLQKKVARLKRKIAAVNKRLDRQARAYDKLRNKFKSLHKYDSLQGDIAEINHRLDDWPAEATPQAFNALSEDQLEQARRIEELANEIRTLQKSLSWKTDDGAALAARTQELEAYAAELTQARQGQRGRLKKLGKDATRLQEQTSRLEQVTIDLAERTQALETRSEELGRHDGAWSSQLQAAEQHLEDFRKQAARLTDRMTELQAYHESVEQQLSTLGRDQEVSRDLLDGLLTRTDALEERALSHDQRAEDLAKQLASLSEVLQGLIALKVGRRLDDQGLRSDRLEQSLDENQKRLAALEQGDEVLSDRLNTAIGDTEALVGRIQAQDDSSEELREQVQRLVSEVNESAVNASRQQEQQQTLEERSNDLILRQAKQNTDAEGLQRRLRQRTLLGLVLLLLVAAMPGFLLLKPYLNRADPPLAEQPEGSAAQPQAAGDTKALQKEVAELRRHLTRLDGSVDELNQSVEGVNASVNPELPGQVVALAHAVESLSREGLEQQQTSAGLLAGQEQVSAEIKEVAADVEVLEQQLDQAPVLEVVARAKKERQWLKAQQLGLYTLQVIGVYKRESLARFVRQQGIESDSAIYITEYRGQKWHVLFYGVFDSAAQATSAARKLPKALTDHKPWVRQIPETGDLFPL